MAKSKSRQLRERADAKAHCFYVVWQNADGSFKTDWDGSIMVVMVRPNLGEARCSAYSQGFKGFVIVETIGKKTSLKKGIVVYRDAG